MIRKLLDETPRSAAEWIMWMDSDTLLFNSSVRSSTVLHFCRWLNWNHITCLFQFINSVIHLG